jgi:hypothetical protein
MLVGYAHRNGATISHAALENRDKVATTHTHEVTTRFCSNVTLCRLLDAEPLPRGQS